MIFSAQFKRSSMGMGDHCHGSDVSASVYVQQGMHAGSLVRIRATALSVISRDIEAFSRGDVAAQRPSGMSESPTSRRSSTQARET